MKLYIIGNGFDKAHNLPTGYEDFQQFLLDKKDQPMINGMIKLIGLHNPKDKWSQVEAAMGEINTRDMIPYFQLSIGENESVLTESLGADEDGEERDIPTTDSEKIRQIEEIIEIAKKIPEEMQAWAKQIEVCPEKIRENIKIDMDKVRESVNDKDSRILNFNFTTVLEKLYGVDKERICYIHGNNTENSDKIYFGHGENPPVFKGRMNTLYEVLPLLEQYYNEEGALCIPNIRLKKILYKEPEKRLEVNSDFFGQMKELTEVYVFGFSFGTADMSYIRRILKDAPNVKWNIYDFDGRVQRKMTDELCAKLKKIGVKNYSYWNEWEEK